MRRLFAAAESLAIGYGGVSMVSSATGVSRRAIDAGIEELKPARRMGKIGSPAEGRVRKKGGGRKKNVIKDATLEGDLERLVDPAKRGETRNRRYAGPARVFANWSRNSSGWTTK